MGLSFRFEGEGVPLKREDKCYIGDSWWWAWIDWWLWALRVHEGTFQRGVAGRGLTSRWVFLLQGEQSGGKMQVSDPSRLTLQTSLLILMVWDSSDGNKQKHVRAGAQCSCHWLLPLVGGRGRSCSSYTGPEEADDSGCVPIRGLHLKADDVTATRWRLLQTRPTNASFILPNLKDGSDVS